MSDSQWSETFFHYDSLVKVVLTNNKLLIHHPSGLTYIPLNFNACFTPHYDQHRNMTAFTIDSTSTIRLSHDNPTVLSQWECQLSSRIHRTDFLSEYEPREKVGEGLSATVFAAVRRKDKVRVAIKVFSRMRLQDKRQQLAVQNEVQILRRVGIDGSGYFPQLIGTFLTEKSLYVVYEWSQGMSLRQCVVEKNLKEEQLCGALRRLTVLGIAHRDIKPDNIIYDPQTHKIRLIDFGFAVDCSSNSVVYPNCGTPGFAAPEVLEKGNKRITCQVDVFAWGVTLYYLLFGRLPYSDSVNILLANKECKFAFDRSLLARQRLYDLIRRTVCSITYRITLEQVTVHSYLKKEGTTQTFNQETLKSELLTKMRRQELQLMNQRMQKKLEQRVIRGRISSVRTQSLLRRVHRETSVHKIKRLITELI